MRHPGAFPSASRRAGLAPGRKLITGQSTRVPLKPSIGGQKEHQGYHMNSYVEGLRMSPVLPAASLLQEMQERRRSQRQADGMQISNPKHQNLQSLFEIILNRTARAIHHPCKLKHEA